MIRRALLLALIGGLIGVFPVPASGNGLDDDLQEVRQRARAITTQLGESESDRSVIARKLVAAVERLDTVEREVAATGARLTRIGKDHKERSDVLEDVRGDLSLRLARIAALRDQRRAAHSDARRSVLQVYKTGGAVHPLIAFSATAVVDVSVGIAYAEVLTRHRSASAHRYSSIVEEKEAEARAIRDVEVQIARQARALESSTVDLESFMAVLALQRNEVASEHDLQASLLREIDAQIHNFEDVLKALAREESTIRAEIRAASQAEGTRPGQLLRPVPGAISSGFGMRMHPIFGNMRMHNGIDMRARQGDRIRAAASGTVIWSGVRGGFGNTVMIDHGGGMVTLYAHQSRLAVSVGEKVKAGETIGYIGSTGVSTGPHLHFEVRIEGVPVDPIRYL